MSAATGLAPRVLVGLVASLAAVALLTIWLVSSAHGDLAREQRQRESILVANAVSASLAGLDGARLAERLLAWQSSKPSLESIRVVVGRQLVASTRHVDQAPRALGRDERELFDLAHALRAAAEIKAQEGAARRKLLHAHEDGTGVITVTVPFEPEGRFEGVVQMRMLGAATPVAQRTTRPELALLMLALAAGAGALLRVQPGRRFDLGRGLALLILLALALAYQRSEIAGIEQSIVRADSALAETQRATARLYQEIGAARAADPAAASAWDTDAYRRPLNLVSHGGELLADGAVAKAFGHPLDYFLWPINALGILTLLFFVQGHAARAVRALREHAGAYAYVAPAMIGMLVLVFFPFFYGIVLAFTDTTLFNEALPLRERWIGLDNFVAILGDFDLVRRTAEGLVWNYQNFYWTLMMTVVWTVTNVTIGVTVGFLLALALNTEGLRGKPIYRVLLILPWAIPNYITALVWRGMFHPQFGVINQALQLFGIAPVAWFDGVASSFLTGVATNGWLSFPFMMVVILGALQSIPREMYEAAEVEGATQWQQLKAITLPLLRPTLVPAIVLSVVWTFNMFNIIFLVSGGEPAGATEILITRAYKIAFEQYQYAYAAAYSTVIFAILLMYGYFQTRVTRATESY